MSETLFDLTAEYLQLAEMLTDPEQDEQVITDTLDAIMGEIEVKSEGYVAVLNRLDMELDACKKQYEAWAIRKRVRENAIKRLKKALTDTMIATNKEEIAAGDVKIKLVKNGGKLPLEYEEEFVPDNYKRVVYETDTEKIRKALDDGEELGWARYGERGKHIMIK